MIKDTPVAVCTKCGKYTDNLNHINNRCPITYVKSGRCKGVYRSMLAYGDWKDCGNCTTTGIVNDIDCTPCQGYGQICIRKNI